MKWGAPHISHCLLPNRGGRRKAHLHIARTPIYFHVNNFPFVKFLNLFPDNDPL